jgi:hypothetical protein
MTNRTNLLRTFLVLIFLSGCATVEAPAETPSEPPAERICGGIAGLPCGEGEYCRYEPGTCHIADGQGVCREQRRMCTMDYNPVCGCDGKTYGNACTAAASGVSINYKGECNREESGD